MLGVGEKKKVPFIDYFKWRMNEWMSESMNAGPVKSLSSLFTIHVQLLSPQYNTVKGQNMHRGQVSFVTLRYSAL